MKGPGVKRRLGIKVSPHSYHNACARAEHFDSADHVRAVFPQWKPFSQAELSRAAGAHPAPSRSGNSAGKSAIAPPDSIHVLFDRASDLVLRSDGTLLRPDEERGKRTKEEQATARHDRQYLIAKYRSFRWLMAMPYPPQIRNRELSVGRDVRAVYEP